MEQKDIFQRHSAGLHNRVNLILLHTVAFGGDPPAPTTNESMASILGAYTQHIPGLINVTSGPSIQANKDLELSKLGIAQETSPAYAKLQSDLYGQYAPTLAKQGAAIDRTTKIANARTDADIAKGAGRRLILNAKKTDELLNPEFYKTRELESNKLGSLLDSINIDSPNIEAERLINAENVRSGNTMPTSTTAIANAIDFGNERMKRQQNLNSILNTATNFLQPSKSSFDAFGRNSTTGGGQGNFTGITPTGTTGYASGQTLGNTLLNTTSANQLNSANINANRRDTLDRVNETMSSLPSVSC